MWPVPEVLLGVLAMLIVLGYLSGPKPANVRSDARFGTGKATGANLTEQHGIGAAAGNTAAIPPMSQQSTNDFLNQPTKS